MTKNKRSSDDDSDYDASSDPKRSRGTPKRAPPLYKARVIETADSHSVRVNSSTADLDETILVRMKKCLARANHPETPEAEAKAALFLASKLMKTYNVTTAEVLAHETPEAQRNYAGSTIVSIERRDGDLYKKVPQSNYIGELCDAMEIFFGCKSFTSSGTGLSVTFYGIAENTVAAGNAFEMVYNLIVEWARPYKGQSGKNSYCCGICEELSARARKEQREEEDRAKKAEQDARIAREKQEQADDQSRLSRLHELQAHVEDEEAVKLEVQVGRPNERDHQAQEQGHTVHSELQTIHDMYPSSDEESDQEDYGYEEWNGFSDDEDEEPNTAGIDYVTADFNDDDGSDGEHLRQDDINEQIDRLASTVRPSNQSQPSNELGQAAASLSTSRRDSGVAATENDEEEPKWKSHMSLIKFRETSDKIADDYVKEQKIKIRTGRSRSGVTDWSAFRMGKKDGKKIDVRKKTIAENSKEEREQASGLLLSLS